MDMHFCSRLKNSVLPFVLRVVEICTTILFTKKNNRMDLQLNVGDNELGYDEVVDTLNDVLDVTDDLEAVLGDGVQPTDLLVVVNNYGRLKEIANDFPVFWAQLKDLTSEEANQVYTELAQRRGEDLELISAKVVAGMRRALRTYRFGAYVLHEGQDILADWQEFFTELKADPTA